jgi:hypothetical protein
MNSLLKDKIMTSQRQVKRLTFADVAVPKLEVFYQKAAHLDL